MRTGVLAAATLALALAGCSSDAPQADPAGDVATTTTTTTRQAGTFNQELHDELLALLGADQEERLGDGPLNDQERTERLKVLVTEHGWPTISLVGEDGEDAAWAIAQHSDHDPKFQAHALDLIREAVEAGDAAPGNLAYRTDRVAAGAGDPQVYGTQVGCGPDGPAPAEPINAEATVEAARAEVGLPPLEDYLADMVEICAQDVSQGTGR